MQQADSCWTASEEEVTPPSSTWRLVVEAMAKALQDRQELDTFALSISYELYDAAQACESCGGEHKSAKRRPRFVTTERRPISRTSIARYRRIVDQAEHMEDFTYLCHVLRGGPTPSRLYLKRMAEARFGDRIREAFVQAGIAFSGLDVTQGASPRPRYRISL
eukprot:TRINITY_DN10213_c0_g2_i1.p1 TRINITY_DN10213_c0_g2~~TRINITY_DN10213_c0_g2_i1.p1  ORF type:complete len:163 (-),score=11.86 TRINITY_DN10213_c0_g2_i1:161-649(-)